MSNTYFQFKKFRINQDQCAMKVCTDSCLQGALAAREIGQRRLRIMLDIGTGTGLLSLMLAQAYTFERIDALEINALACRQARQNVAHFIMKNNIRVIQKDVRRFYPTDSYDFIVCNPPFFSHQLPSNSSAKNLAMHSSHLTDQDLLQSCFRLLSDRGICCLMIPSNKEDGFISAMKEQSLFAKKIFRIRNQPGKPVFRTILFCSKKQHTQNVEEMCIRNRENEYTTEFKDLLQSYYLYL